MLILEKYEEKLKIVRGLPYYPDTAPVNIWLCIALLFSSGICMQ